MTDYDKQREITFKDRDSIVDRVFKHISDHENACLSPFHCPFVVKYSEKPQFDWEISKLYPNNTPFSDVVNLAGVDIIYIP